MSAYTQQDYEAIEAAVLESPRGRWFLDEFTRRTRAADTHMLLEAIRKLERGVAESASIGRSPHQVSDELAAGLQSLSENIGATLDGIMHTQDVWGAVTEMPLDTGEALIGQVRNTMDQLAGVRRQIEALLAAQSDNAPGGGTPLSAENLGFFEGDEDLFEPVPEAASSAEAACGPAAAPSLVLVDEKQGRKPGAAPASAISDPKLAAEPKTKPKAETRDRIVFIHRASSRETSIPLVDESDSAVPAGGSQPAS